MRLTIITINYNGSESTLNLLRTLKAQTDNDFSVIVVDNSSEKNDLDNLKKNIGSGAVLVENKENFGFSGGNNTGIREALKNGSEWVLLLNNDAWVEKDFISSLRSVLGSKTGILGIPLDEGPHTAYAGKIEWLKPTLGHIYNPGPVDGYAIGGGMLIHKDVFEKIGFLDEKYFLYFEDADFCLRAKNKGISVDFLEKPKAYHEVSGTTKKLGSPLLLRYHFRNALYFNRKNGPWHIKLFLWPWSFWIIKKQFVKIILNYKREESFAILSGVVDFYKNRMGKINV